MAFPTGVPLPQGTLETGLCSEEGGEILEGNCGREMDWGGGVTILGGTSCDWVGCGGECIRYHVIMVVLVSFSFWKEPV